MFGMKNYFINGKKEKIKKLEEQILEDAHTFDTIVVLCLGKYEENLSPYLTFASKVGAILKTNQFPVFGEETSPILIDNNKLPKISREIVESYSNPFVLVVMNSRSDAKKVVGNVYYENKSFENDSILAGNATLTLCGSYGKNKEECTVNSLSMDFVNEIATDISMSIMKALNKKQEINDLEKLEITRRLEKETEN